MSSLGNLHISLLLETAQFQQGLNKSTHQSHKFAKQFEVNLSAAQHKAEISQVSQAVSELNSKLSATHTVNSISGGSISGMTISGGTVSGTTINAATIEGGVINGATGTFRGTLYAENIIGDLVKMYFCNRGGTVKIPAMPFARKVCVLPFMIYANNSSTLPKHIRASEVIAYIKRNSTNIISTRVTDSNGYGTYKMVDGDFDLPMNMDVTLGYEVNFRGDDIMKAPSKI